MSKSVWEQFFVSVFLAVFVGGDVKLIVYILTLNCYIYKGRNT